MITDARSGTGSDAAPTPAHRRRGFFARNRSRVRAAESIVAVFILWEFAGRFLLKDRLFFVPFSAVLASFVELWSKGTLQVHIWTSLAEFLLGLLLGAVVGVTVVLAMAVSTRLRDYLDPWVSLLYSTPLLALAPLLILWFGIGIESKVAVIFLVVVFPVLLNTYTGVLGTDRHLIEAARSLCARRDQIFTKVMLPADTWKLNTPLREAEVHPALWEALRDDTVNTLGTDHISRPLSREQMDKGNVWQTISGFTSRVELALPMMLSEGVNRGRISLERLVEVACENPARTFGIYPKKGAIEVGSDADLIVVDLDKVTTARDDKVYAASGWTIINGRELKGWPVMTIRRGKVVARWNDEQERNEVIDRVPGRYVRRHVGHALYPIGDKIQTGVGS